MKKNLHPFRTYIFFAEAWIALSFARIILVYMPFRKIAPRLKNNVTKSVNKATEFYCYEETGRSVKRACKYTPWRTMCFEQAIAAKMMLNRRNLHSELYFGVYKNEMANTIEAHAWLRSGDRIITGGSHLDKFKIISVF